MELQLDKQAWNELEDPSFHSLCTGPAGSGKSTLIRAFIKAHEGECVVLAPTGIAAQNIGGQTVHSFFHFPARPLGYNQIKYLNPAIDLDAMKREIIENAKYFIIDEISMVRADLMDQIWWFFHKNWPLKPAFAGKKLIMIGDMDQLPPVVKEGPEREMISQRYESEFFFDAKCWQDPEKENEDVITADRHAPIPRTKFKVTRLTKIWRQTDPVFIGLLNNIKANTLSPFDIATLNKKCYKDGVFKPEDGVFLCTTNAISNEINAEMVSRLPGETIRLKGEITGNFDAKDCAVESIIDLKIGCRLMVMKNCHGVNKMTYANGQIGELLEYKEHIVDQEYNEFDEPTPAFSVWFLKIKLDSGDIVEVSQHEFESIEFVYDKAEDKISHAITGKFVQYPVKVAYAMTVHKSQGQTFDKVIIDLGERGAFAHGQTYVALSRCRSMEGLILRRPITAGDLIYNKNILKFNKSI